MLPISILKRQFLQLPSICLIFSINKNVKIKNLVQTR